jgi:hypothetical protein
VKAKEALDTGRTVPPKANEKVPALIALKVKVWIAGA